MLWPAQIELDDGTPRCTTETHLETSRGAHSPQKVPLAPLPVAGVMQSIARSKDNCEVAATALERSKNTAKRKLIVFHDTMSLLLSCLVQLHAGDGHCAV